MVINVAPLIYKRLKKLNSGVLVLVSVTLSDRIKKIIVHDIHMPCTQIVIEHYTTHTSTHTISITNMENTPSIDGINIRFAPDTRYKMRTK